MALAPVTSRGSGAGAMTQIAESTLAADGTFDFSSIPAAYNHLLLTGLIRGTNATASDAAKMQFNGDTGNNYTDEAFSAGNATLVGGGSGGTRSFINIGNVPSASATASYFGAIWVWIPYYASTASFKGCLSMTDFISANAAASANLGVSAGAWASATAITRITLQGNATANLLAASRVALYGLL